jgi:hypothetical protein
METDLRPDAGSPVPPLLDPNAVVQSCLIGYGKEILFACLVLWYPSYGFSLCFLIDLIFCPHHSLLSYNVSWSMLWTLALRLPEDALISQALHRTAGTMGL